MENALDLNRHPPGPLPRHASYLHPRTAGRIGSLARLIHLDRLAEEARRSPHPPTGPNGMMRT
ncbi:hypothetical protein [Streptomyces sp. NBC_01171]|uniref:hypothetical protein n=1 Tax=Streptomyces sp. NBC_01171 TaxID=2903757 RepID=UPI00386D6060